MRISLARRAKIADHQTRLGILSDPLSPWRLARLGAGLAGGYLGFDPDENPVIWTADEYAAKPGWGARLPSTFRTYGTPPVGAPEESVTADWPAPPSSVTG